MMHIVTMACTPSRGVRICQLHTWHRGQCIAHHRPEQLNNTKARSAQPSIRIAVFFVFVLPVVCSLSLYRYVRRFCVALATGLSRDSWSGISFPGRRRCVMEPGCIVVFVGESVRASSTRN